jgi:hypothetical protein
MSNGRSSVRYRTLYCIKRRPGIGVISTCSPSNGRKFNAAVFARLADGDGFALEAWPWSRIAPVVFHRTGLTHPHFRPDFSETEHAKTPFPAGRIHADVR